MVRGEPGVGKTVLLDYLAGQARECQVVRAVGVQTEMELAFAGLHQLCAPILGRAEHLPAPQRAALRTAFGLAAGPPPDRFLVGLAALSLLSEVGGKRSLICLVDDEQWLDQASAQALGFVARRLAADPVGLVFAAREPGAELAGLPELEIRGLRESDARALLDSALAGPLDDRVRDQIVAETQGNPLALLELARGLSPAELAGGFGLPDAQPGATAAVGADCRELPQAAGGVARTVPAAPAAGGGRTIRRPSAAFAGGRAAGHTRSRCGARGGRGPGGVRHPGAVPASAAAFGVVPGGIGLGAPGRARRAGRGHRPGDRARAPGLAPRPGRGQARRGGRGGAGAVGGPAQARGGLAAAAAFLERSALLTADPRGVPSAPWPRRRPTCRPAPSAMS